MDFFFSLSWVSLVSLLCFSCADLEIVLSVSGNFNVLLKNFCEKWEYIGSKTRNYAKKCFWWWGYVQRNKVVIVFKNRKSWVYHKNWYNLSKTNNFCSNFRNIFAVQLCKYLKIKKTFCETKFFLGTRFPSSTTISSSAEVLQ